MNQLDTANALPDRLAAFMLREGERLGVESTVARTVAAWTRQVASRRAEGHSCVLLPDHAGQAVDGGAEGENLPILEVSRKHLQAHPLVGDGQEVSPLVLDADRLAFWRDYQAEQRLARAFASRAGGQLDPELTPAVYDVFQRLYPEAKAEAAPLATAIALLTPLCVLTGGPGTGKTTAVVRMLALLLTADPELRVALAAPTGKAAARLQESIHGRAGDLPVDDDIRRRLLLPVTTVHRMLGLAPGRARPRHDAQRPLAADVVIVDEASMVDLQLMDLLVAAVRPDARLVLVGDRDQLASVDAGAVLGDLVVARGSTGDDRSAAFAARVQSTFGLKATIEETPHVLADSLVELRVNYRFKTRPGIASVAAALRDGDADTMIEVLNDDSLPDARRLELSRAKLVGVLDPLLAELPDPSEPDPAVWLDVLEHRMRVLGATHLGMAGVAALNDLVEARLRARGWRTDDPWYHGRPVLIDRNHASLGLANGDLGVCLPDPADPSRTLFFLRSGEAGPPRSLSVEQLPAHRTAWAITVHKSQGSEFDDVLVSLPRGGHPLLSRELLYTGVTRARQRVTIFADEATLRAAVAAVQERRTGLADALRSRVG